MEKNTSIFKVEAEKEIKLNTIRKAIEVISGVLESGDYADEVDQR